MSLLLSPIDLARLSLVNRVVMSPMCMYEVKKRDGVVTPFHFAHYGARAIGKVGLLVIEATAVDPDGRITDQDLGLWNEEQAKEMKKMIDHLHYLGSKVGIQLNHAGRKAKDAVRPLSPGAGRFSKDYQTPHKMTIADIKQVQHDFLKAAERAVSSGVDMIEIHGAHGYLIDQFLSPATNKREDDYGGSLENRYRFVKEIITSIRGFYQGSLWMRLSVTDYLEDGEQNSIHEWQTIGGWLEEDGIDCLDISTGGLMDQRPNIPIYPGYQAGFAATMKQAVSIPVAAVGLLDDPGLCEYLLQSKQVDVIMIGRGLIRNINWLPDAAKRLHDQAFEVYNDSYQRGQLD